MTTAKTSQAPMPPSSEHHDAHRSDAPKVRARRLSTSVRAGGGGGGGGGGLNGPPPSGGEYVTFGALGTWSCRG